MFGSISIDGSPLRRGVTFSRLSQLTSLIYRASNFVLLKHKAILLINSKMSSDIISFWKHLLANLLSLSSLVNRIKYEQHMHRGNSTNIVANISNGGR